MECLRNNFQNGVVLNGRFQTISPLNHGSFGMVFKAKDLKTDQFVAIKCMTKRSTVAEAGFDLAVDDNSEELLCHRRLGSHPNIVSLIDSFETDVHQYLVLEYCSRGDLYEAIRTDCGPLETEHVRRFMLELVDAVAYMHSKGIYHRDIKPENILLTEDRAMKLGDFGLATTEKWSYESTVGSDRYMAPEQYDSAGAGYSPAQADIWAIGVCLLNILFSRNPFTTPTEADPLFLDFSRDKQSLFDVFPSMSQDTYECIVECMNLDPNKRSLVGLKNALQRVVSFTTLDEDDDDFCCGGPRTIATANRQPLRTPSILSPQMEQGAFPWAKALHASPAKPARKLSAIADSDSYTEELFPKSEATTDWMSSVQTSSISSVMTSDLGASAQPLDFSKPLDVPRRPGLMAGSMPITMKNAKGNLNAMSLVFGGKKDGVSKSWSDMWDEDVEEEEEEHSRQLQALRERNARTWSHESEVEATPTQKGQVPALAALVPDHGKPEASPVHDIFNIDGDLVADGFFFQDAPAVKQPENFPPRYSPPPKRGIMDKWAALGERRRRANTASPEAKAKSPIMTKSRQQQQQFGFEFNKHQQGLGTGVWDHYANHNSYKFNRDRTNSRDCPWNKARDYSNWRRDKRHDFGDVEWVGNWQEAH